MFAMFKQLFTAITLYFKAAEKTASAVNHLADWAEETAAAFADEARIERQKKLAMLKSELKAIESKQPKAA
jgi:LytS/YehU family sensor histidine kinase